MSDTDRYEYVAVADILHNGVLAFRAGDPVPKSNVDEYGYLKDELVVTRKDYKPESGEAPDENAVMRGEMPPGLRGGPEDNADTKPSARKTPAKEASK